MRIKDFIELFDSNDIKKFDIFFIDNGLTLNNISKQDNNGKKVETEEVIAIYQWKPINVNNLNKFNYINFNKWHGNENNSLDIQIREKTLFGELLNQILLIEDFEKYNPKGIKKNQEIFSFFFNSKKGINIQFINNRIEFSPLPSSGIYTVFINRYKVNWLRP